VSEAWSRAAAALEAHLAGAFEALDANLASAAAALDFRPAAGAWSIREIGEHVTLVDHFLLVLADKIARKSLRRVARGDAWPVGEPRFEHLARLARRELRWPHPEHMAPTGEPDVAAIRARLSADLGRCQALLAELPRGEGTLHRIRMSVVEGDDRLDLYQFLEVIALHAQRHARQMARNLGGWRSE